MAQISYVKYSELFYEFRNLRFDAEFFREEFLEIEDILKKLNSKYLNDNFFTSLITDGDHGNPVYSNESNSIPYLKVDEITETGIKLPSSHNLDFEYFQKQSKKNHIEVNDVLITTVGTIGKVCVVNSYFNAVLSRDIGKIKLTENLNPYFLQSFLSSKYGKLQMDRISSGGLQKGLYISHIKQILVPLLSQSFQLKIEEMVKSAYEKQKQSKELYKEAENLLLKELNLLDFKPKHQLFFTEHSKEVENSKRIDADYFQPKYKEIIQKIEEYEGGFDLVENIVIFNEKNFIPENDKKYCYIPLSKVSNSGEIEVPEKEFGKNLPTRARRLLKTGDIILSSIEGSLETSALIDKEYNNFICSNGFYVFNSEKINSETLLILFKSKLMIELLQRASKGTILGGYTKEELKKIKIPLLSNQIQQQIADLVQESHKLRKESKQLLEDAKLKVEEEIEKEANKN